MEYKIIIKDVVRIKPLLQQQLIYGNYDGITCESLPKSN
ncbi:hypothetical protein CWATWH8502_4635 [Crocosphaera watsonii WH 8502]|uniref:Uncharacterized protein n=5 Tax=Crocosphaera watsonii TaxID=263511 RepID=T2K0F1_CROWT|nr:hypothetical protein CWATWH0003_3174 [Crocosphaera watsonii WH 0003]CCQ51489.1 hypothetical protein CWATWH8502_4635 [Crocosphaera watsonii WH 8502]CCQ57933.1 hypothetical protein CWATWH0005_3387 [Crocosphaera watsonii WH 0005]CCQ60887.1 hypothetical protein CWATWH0401_3785 [Crocosphaera watsonii WH 0401]CCQ70929.1 hypothetical protein CWATWH0402_3288 [Crocosphaera watsonii WH 0402]